MQKEFSNWPHFRYWLFHVTLNAAPSFIIACTIPTRFLDARIAGMIAGVVTFIVGYTQVTGSLWYQQKVSGTSFGTALKCAMRIRSSLAAIALVGAMGWINGRIGDSLAKLASLELYAGCISGILVKKAGRWLLVRELRVTLTSDDPSERAQNWWLGDMGSAIPTFLWTLTEGIILSLLMLTIAVLIWFGAKLRRRFS